MGKLSLDDILRANPHAPHTDDGAMRLARMLFDPTTLKAAHGQLLDLEGQPQLAASDAPSADSCGEQTFGLLDALLASDLLSQGTRSEIRDLATASKPGLEKTKLIDRFRFHWTETSADPRHNVSEGDIDLTGDVLNEAWGLYVARFRAPQAEIIDGRELIEVEVYYEELLYGSTSSHSNRIFLNSRDVVSDDCRRYSTSAHELFHRVEYTYGYVTGTAGQRWWVEALGSWSQKSTYPDQHDYVSRVDAGLLEPQRALLDRSYDACHFWKYLGERLRASGDFPEEHDVIARFMDEYSGNGLDAKSACDHVAVNSTLQMDFDEFFGRWATANIAKDSVGLGGAGDLTLSYADNDRRVVNCGHGYGPYRKILPAGSAVLDAAGGDYESPTYGVRAYGTDYYVFELAAGVTTATVEFEPSDLGADYAIGVVQVLGGQVKDFLECRQSGTGSWAVNAAGGVVDRVLLAVSGLRPSGTYQVRAFAV